MRRRTSDTLERSRASILCFRICGKCVYNNHSKTRRSRPAWRFPRRKSGILVLRTLEIHPPLFLRQNDVGNSRTHMYLERLAESGF